MFPFWPLLDRSGRTVAFRYGYKPNITHTLLVLGIMWEKSVCVVLFYRESLPVEVADGVDPLRSPHSITGTLYSTECGQKTSPWLSMHTSAISRLMLVCWDMFNPWSADETSMWCCFITPSSEDVSCVSYHTVMRVNDVSWTLVPQVYHAIAARDSLWAVEDTEIWTSEHF